MRNCAKCPGLGAIPVAADIVSSIIIWMVKDRYSAYQAAQMAAQQYEAFRQFNEAQITGLALELGERTQIPYWDWFNTLRSVQRYQLALPDGQRQDNGDQQQQGDRVSKTPQWVWMLLAGLGAVAIFTLMED